MFAIQRGQIDPLTLVFILAALPLLWQKSGWVRGPGRRGTLLRSLDQSVSGANDRGAHRAASLGAALGFAAVGVAIALLDLTELRQFLVNNQLHMQQTEAFNKAFPGGPRALHHRVALVWRNLWLDAKLNWLGLIPGKIAVAILAAPALAWVTWYIYRCPQRAGLNLSVPSLDFGAGHLPAAGFERL